MKNSALISMFLVLLVFTFGCKKDKDETTSSTASFSAKVDGTLFPAKIIAAGYAESANLTTITGAASVPPDMISLQFIGSATGTYPVNENNSGSVVKGISSFWTIFSPSPVGQITITKYDLVNKLISGTFYFTAEDIEGNVMRITEGKFENVALTIL